LKKVITRKSTKMERPILNPIKTKKLAYHMLTKKRLYKKKRPCDICGKKQHPAKMFDDFNITCMMCDHFTCNQCTKVRWKDTWKRGDFWKPKQELIGLKHEVWNCPSCRDGFDRFTSDGTGRTDPRVKFQKWNTPNTTWTNIIENNDPPEN